MPGQEAKARPWASGARADTYDPDLAIRWVQEALRGVHRDSMDVANFYGQDPHASVDAANQIETIPHREDHARVQSWRTKRTLASTTQGAKWIATRLHPLASAWRIQQKKRQLSYFNRHPERRPVHQVTAPRPFFESGLTDESAVLESVVPDSDTEDGAGLRPVKAGSFVNASDDDEPRQKTPPAHMNGAGAGAGASKSKTASAWGRHRPRRSLSAGRYHWPSGLRL
ncbi:hypothetical protein HDZ31DRAFT_67925 [Schizophyllum fasciatum]